MIWGGAVFSPSFVILFSVFLRGGLGKGYVREYLIWVHVEVCVCEGAEIETYMYAWSLAQGSQIDIFRRGSWFK